MGGCLGASGFFCVAGFGEGMYRLSPPTFVGSQLQQGVSCSRQSAAAGAGAYVYHQCRCLRVLWSLAGRTHLLLLLYGCCALSAALLQQQSLSPLLQCAARTVAI